MNLRLLGELRHRAHEGHAEGDGEERRAHGNAVVQTAGFAIHGESRDGDAHGPDDEEDFAAGERHASIISL